MLAASIVDVLGAQKPLSVKVIVWIGTPLEARTITTFFAMGLVRFPCSLEARHVKLDCWLRFRLIAGILLIVAAGGGFKQTLVDPVLAMLLHRALRRQTLIHLLPAGS